MQKMKWGVFFKQVKTRGVFVKKKWKMGVFWKKVESRGVFRKKSGKWGCFVKSGPFLNTECIMYSISIFLFYTLLIWQGVRTRRTAALPTGREHASSMASVTVCVKRIATMQLGSCQCRSSAGMPRHWPTATPLPCCFQLPHAYFIFDESRVGAFLVSVAEWVRSSFLLPPKHSVSWTSGLEKSYHCCCRQA